MSTVQLFNNGEFEISVEYTGDTFRVHGMLVAEALGYRKGSDLARYMPDHCKILDKPVSAGRSVGALTRPREMGVWYLTEEGFYRAIAQRATGRIPNLEVRERVERFQSWAFGEVLPAIRRRGHYGFEEPQSLTWEQLSQVLYQRYGLKLSVGQITNALRSGGILRQNGNPRSKYQDWFWLTEAGTVNVLSFHVPKIAAKVSEIRMALIERLRWHQMRLEFEGVGSDVPTVT